MDIKANMVWKQAKNSFERYVYMSS